MIDLEKGVSWAIETANNTAHGYAQDNRWGPDYDCSSFVISALKKAGFSLTATYTGNMRADLLKNGFKNVTESIRLSSGAGVQRGDVLLNDEKHTALAIGNGKVVQASINEKGTVSGGRPGDQTGREIYVHAYYNYPWNVVLRYEHETTTNATMNTEESAGDDMALLKYGAKGYQVWVMQTLLIALGNLDNSDGKQADGIFGIRTLTALKKFQGEHDLEADGECGPLTWSKLLKGEKN